MSGGKFKPAQHFFETESQHAATEARMRTVDLVYGSAAFVLMVGTLIAADQIGVVWTSGFFGLYTLAVVAVAAGSQIATWLAARPLLAALPRSNERITFGERVRMTAASSPWWRLVSAGLVYAFLTVWLTPIGFNRLAHDLSLDWESTAAAWFWAIALAATAAYHLYLTAIKFYATLGSASGQA